ncbi:MAG: HAMP domain-containing sensor histidine kinase [Actinomycetota bacterium]
MTRRILAGYLIVTLVALLVLELPLAVIAADRERSAFAENTEEAAEAIADNYASAISNELPAVSTRLIAQSEATRSQGRVVLLDAEGIIDRDTAPGTDLSESFRIDVERALEGITANRIIEGEGGREERLVAVPATSDGEVVGVVLLTAPTGPVEGRVQRIWLALFGLGLFVLAVSAVVGWAIARSVSRPIRRLQEATAQLADGELDVKVDIGAAPADLREFAEVLQETTDRLRTTLDRQRSFLADASHQLRTPLTALRLRLENVEPAVAHDARGDLEAAIDETQRMTELVGQLLRLARAEEEGDEPVAVDLTEIAHERRDMWEALAEEQGVSVVVDGIDRVVAASAIPGAVEQILDNYLSNALAVAPVGSTIRLVTVWGNGYRELHVVDEGPGLDDDALERAFDRFWRGDPSTPGTGIGLPIVAMLARASGGRAELRRAPSGGVDAVCVLPPASRPVAAASPTPVGV